MGEEDVVGILVSILDTNWNGENVTKPAILTQWDNKRVDLRESDKVLIYETSFTKDQGDLVHNTEDRTGVVSVDIRTVESETRYNELYTEVERIRKFKRRNPHADWDKLEYVRRQLFHRAGSWRAVIDYRFEKYNEAI